MKTIRVKLEKVSRTDLMCISCGGFRTEFAVLVTDAEPQVGVHKKCFGNVRVARVARTQKAVVA